MRSILHHVLPASARVVAGHAGMRTRVSYPLPVRTTGLGRIEGGELVLASANRSADVLAGVADLARAGIAGLVLLGTAADIRRVFPNETDVPIIVVPDGGDVQSLRERIDRYIARRRRELFALEGRLHRSLVDAAIGGASLGGLLEAASEETRATAFLDRGGDVIYAPVEAEPPAPAVLTRARAALDRGAGGRVESEGPPRLLAMEVAAGSERKGLVSLVGLNADRDDEDEAVLLALASAAAIAIAREPATELPTVENLLSSREAQTTMESSNQPWTSVALQSQEIPPAMLQRALVSELGARSVSHLTAVESNSLVILTQWPASGGWDAIVRGTRTRIAPADVRAGIGRPYHGAEGARRSVREAISALAHGAEQITRYVEIELAALLRSIPEREQFVHGRLGPLLDGAASQRELIQTAREYLASGRNAKEAARRLQVHRNTLLYRLRRLEDILQLDWDDADAVFALDLALRLDAVHGDD